MTIHGPPWGAALLLATLSAPVLLLLACFVRRWRGAIPFLLGAAPLPGLMAAFLCPQESALAVDEARLHLSLQLTRPGALLLGTASLLWSLAGAYASSYLRDDPRRLRFAVAWLLSLLGCLGVFIAADLASFYLLYAIVSLAAFGLVVHDGTDAARRAGRIYLALAVAGEALLLMAFVLLASGAPGQSLRIDAAVAALPGSALRDQAMVFLLLGFGLKAGLVPLHGWLPIAHPAAPMPASAVLSGAIVKTGLLGLVLFLPTDGGDWSGVWGWRLAVVGIVTALYSAVVGATQRNPKTLLAYSTASQMGLAAAILGLGLAGGETGMTATFSAAQHVLAKGALFLGVGVILATARHRRLPVLLASAVLGLGFAGLPGTGGALAKLAAKPAFEGSVFGPLSILASVGSALLMTRFVTQVAASPPPEGGAAAPRAGLLAPWLLCTIAALVVPWALCAPATGLDPGASLRVTEVWSSLWPILVGAGIGVAIDLTRIPLPRIPEGDVLVPAERLADAALARTGVVEPLDRGLRTWWVAGLLLLGMVLALGVLA